MHDEAADPRARDDATGYGIDGKNRSCARAAVVDVGNDPVWFRPDHCASNTTERNRSCSSPQAADGREEAKGVVCNSLVGRVDRDRDSLAVGREGPNAGVAVQSQASPRALQSGGVEPYEGRTGCRRDEAEPRFLLRCGEFERAGRRNRDEDGQREKAERTESAGPEPPHAAITPPARRRFRGAATPR